MCQANQTTQSNLPSEESLRVEYQAILDAIKSTKNQQWVIATYVLGLEVGIVKLFADTRSLITNTESLKEYLTYLHYGKWLVLISGFLLTILYFNKICEYRGNKNELLVKLKLKRKEELHRQFDFFEFFIQIGFVLFYLGIVIVVNYFLNTQM